MAFGRSTESPSELIDSYNYCPTCGSERYARQGGTRVCAVCGHNDFNNPIAAVAVWILDADNRLLLIERAKDPGKGKLAPPGGFVDPGESLEEAAQREVLEETGIAVDVLTYLCSAPNDYTYRGLVRPVTDVFFVAKVDAITVRAEASEVSGWKLVPLVEFNPEHLAFSSMRIAYRQLFL